MECKDCPYAIIVIEYKGYENYYVTDCSLKECVYDRKDETM